MVWSVERTELLTKLWDEGVSAEKIAKEMGFKTSGAVCGKAHRLNLKRRKKPSEPRKGEEPGQVQAAVATYRASPPRVIWSTLKKPTTEEEQLKGIRPIEAPEMASTKKGTCTWPIGDPARSGFRMCDEPADGPFCLEHAQTAYRPPKTTGEGLYQSLRRYI